MRNFSYQSQPTVLRTLKEPPKKKKKFNLDRLLFLGIIAFLAFLFIRFMVIKLAFIQVDGQISLDKINVNFTNDIRLQELISLEGEAVEQGDTLFSYVNNTYNETALIERQIKGQGQLSKEYDQLTFQIKNIELELRKEKMLEELLLEEYEKTSRLVLLDLLTKSDLKTAKIELDFNRLKIWELKQQLSIMRERLSLLSNQLGNAAANGGYAVYGSRSFSYYIAPISGLIGQINFSENEVCYETQSVMTIHNTEKVNIKAYFNQEALPDAVRGTKVKIDFPDGSSSNGFISNISVATYELPSEFQKKYEPTQRSILATVEPQNIEDLEIWKKFYKMNVKVIINRWF